MTNFLLANLILWNDFEILRHKANMAVIDLRLRFLRWRLKKLNEAELDCDNRGVIKKCDECLLMQKMLKQEANHE